MKLGRTQRQLLEILRVSPCPLSDVDLARRTRDLLPLTRQSLGLLLRRGLVSRRVEGERADSRFVYFLT